MKLILIRHGETEENVNKIVTGQTPGTLTLVGINQAKKAGIRLKNEKIDIIYVSDLKRTVDTAKEIISHHLNVPVLYVPELREYTRGVFDGKPSELYREHIEKNNLIYWNYQWEGGESLENVQKRIVKFSEELLKKHQDETVLLVTHGAVITTLLQHIYNRKPEDYHGLHPKNTAITILEIFKGQDHKVHLLNCMEHLIKYQENN